MTELNIAKLIEICSETAKEKGFDVTQHQTQLTLIASEVAEALMEIHLDPSNGITYLTAKNIMYNCNELERFRKMNTPEKHEDNSYVVNTENYYEELADIVIRVFSYVGGNGGKELFIEKLIGKIGKNKDRPHKHGKAF